MDARRIAGWLVVCGLLSVHAVAGAQGAPAFEVASVIENRSGGMTRMSTGLLPNFPGGAANPAPGQISITNATLRDVIVLAYGLDRSIARHILRGGPDRILGTRFNIVAKPPDDALPSQTLLMLRTLLADRFQLRTHTETRQVPAYVLTMAVERKLGPRLKPSTADCTSPSLPLDSRERARLGPKDANGDPLCPASMYEFGHPTPGELTIRYVSP